MKKIRFVRGNPERVGDVLNAVRYAFPTSFMGDLEEAAADEKCLIYDDFGIIQVEYVSRALGRLLLERGKEISLEEQGRPVYVAKSAIDGLKKGDAVLVHFEEGTWFPARFSRKTKSKKFLVTILFGRKALVADCIPRNKVTEILLDTYLPVDIIEAF